VLFLTNDDVAIGFYTNFVNDNTIEMDWSEFAGENVMFVFEKVGASQKAAAPYTGPTNLVGTWKATSGSTTVDGSEVNIDLALIGIEMFFVFKADQTIVATANGQTESGTYDFDGKEITVTSNVETKSMALKFLSADKFSIYEAESGANIVFERQ
jgi:hypothetical protein